MTKLTLVILFGVLALAATAEKFVGQPCDSGSNVGPPTPTNDTSCATAGAVRAQHTTSSATTATAPACYFPNATLTLKNESAMHGVRCYSPSLKYGSCTGVAHNYSAAVDFCLNLEEGGVSDYRLAFTNEEQGQLCANGCSLDNPTIMLWYAEMNPTLSPTMINTTFSPTMTTMTPTMTPTTTPTATTMSPTDAPNTVPTTASPTATTTSPTKTTMSPTVTTVAPTTAAPTSTTSPTGSPTTAAPTASPTTVSPTTVSPTTASPTASPTTASPTASPTTASPTASPTTASPTATTKAPTDTTKSPTQNNSTPTAFVDPPSGAAATLATNVLSLAALMLMVLYV